MGARVSESRFLDNPSHSICHTVDIIYGLLKTLRGISVKSVKTLPSNVTITVITPVPYYLSISSISHYHQSHDHN